MLLLLIIRGSGNSTHSPPIGLCRYTQSANLLMPLHTVFQLASAAANVTHSPLICLYYTKNTKYRADPTHQVLRSMRVFMTMYLYVLRTCLQCSTCSSSSSG